MLTMLHCWDTASEYSISETSLHSWLSMYLVTYWFLLIHKAAPNPNLRQAHIIIRYGYSISSRTRADNNSLSQLTYSALRGVATTPSSPSSLLIDQTLLEQTVSWPLHNRSLVGVKYLRYSKPPAKTKRNSSFTLSPGQFKARLLTSGLWGFSFRFLAVIQNTCVCTPHSWLPHPSLLLHKICKIIITGANSGSHLHL